MRGGGLLRSDAARSVFLRRSAATAAHRTAAAQTACARCCPEPVLVNSQHPPQPEDDLDVDLVLRALQENAPLCFEVSLLYVCPEPVLAK
jgi:hypothetical protein